ncbi:hypothetical protein [Haladaptatus sp. DFWS20]
MNRKPARLTGVRSSHPLEEGGVLVGTVRVDDAEEGQVDPS